MTDKSLVEIARANLRYMNKDEAAEWVAELMKFVLLNQERARANDDN